MPKLRLKSALIPLFVTWSLAALIPRRGEVSVQDEPMFEGKTVSFWIDHLPFTAIHPDGSESESGYPERYQTLEQAEAHQKSVEHFRKTARNAIAQIGTNAVPYLIQRLSIADLTEHAEHYEKDLAANVEREVSGRVIRGQAVIAFESLLAHREFIESQLAHLLRNAALPKEVRAAAYAALTRIAPERAEAYRKELKKTKISQGVK